MRRRPLADDRGTVTAELAVALPAVLLVLAGCLGCVHVVTRQAALEGAASAAARALARGDERAATVAMVHRLDATASLSASASGELLCVRLDSRARLMPGWRGVPLRARSCALAGPA